MDDAQNKLLNEVKPVFTDSDNEMLTQTPDKNEILSVLKESNLHSAPGTDGITNYFYLQMFEVIGDSLTRVIREIFTNGKPTESQRTVKMIFANKPNKAGSIKLKDKRKISLLNTDFKLLTGIENRRHHKILDITVS